MALNLQPKLLRFLFPFHEFGKYAVSVVACLEIFLLAIFVWFYLEAASVLLKVCDRIGKCLLRFCQMKHQEVSMIEHFGIRGKITSPWQGKAGVMILNVMMT